MIRTVVMCWGLFLAVYSEEVLLSINCGGEEYIDSTGLTFLKDQHFQGGTNNTHPYTSYIRYTDDPFLYIYTRASDTRVSYFLPLQGDGVYVVILHFLETENKGRVFDVYLGNVVALRDVEVAEFVGLFAALELYIPFNYTKSGQFSYNGTVFNPGPKPKHVAIHLDPKEETTVELSAIQLARGMIDPGRAGKQHEHIRQYQRVKQSASRPPPSIPLPSEKEELAEQITGLSVLCKYPFTILLGGALVFLILTKAKG